MKAADAIEVFGSGPPSLFCFAWRTSEAAVVVGQEAAQNLVGGVQIVGTGLAQLAGETILKGAPKTFNAAFGLRALGNDVGDAELLQRAAELCGFTAADEFFFHRPVVIVANEDAVTDAIETDGDAEAAETGGGAGGNSRARLRWGRTRRPEPCVWHRREIRAG